jgi:hypothetical protein
VPESSVPPHSDFDAGRAPGWRADPWFTGQYRWWDGSAWSGDVFPEAVVSYGAGPTITERPPSDRPPTPAPWHRAVPPPPPPSWVIQQLSRPAPPVLETPPQASTRRLSTKAIMVLLLVFGLALGTTIGLLIPNSPSKRTNAAPSPPPATPSSPRGGSVPAPAQPPSAPGTVGLLQRFSLRQADLPSGQQLALIPGGDTVDDPTLDLCNGTYPSESRRVARLQLAAETADGSSAISTEAVLYDSPAGTVQAFAELQKVASSCPSTPVSSPVGGSTFTTRFGPAPDRSWPAVAGVQRLAYSITTTNATGESASSTVIYLRRGKALLGVYVPTAAAGDPSASVQGKTSAAGIAAIFEQRLASLPASAIGG